MVRGHEIGSFPDGEYSDRRGTHAGSHWATSMDPTTDGRCSCGCSKWVPDRWCVATKSAVSPTANTPIGEGHMPGRTGQPQWIQPRTARALVVVVNGYLTDGAWPRNRQFPRRRILRSERDTCRVALGNLNGSNHGRPVLLWL